MNEIESKDVSMKKEEIGSYPGDMFFGGGMKGVEPDKGSIITEDKSFISKGSNMDMTKPYNIHFTIGGKMFENIITFLNTIDYKAVFQFKKSEVNIITVDGGNTHIATIKLEKVEFSDYTSGLEKDEDEKLIYIDISHIKEELDIDDSHPVDFYVDTLVNNRFYVICGKEYIYKQLNTIITSGDSSAISAKYNGLIAMVARNVGLPEYQRIVISQTSLMKLIKSLGKKKNKEKDKKTPCTIELKTNKLNFIIKDETKGSTIELSGEDIMVYPVKEDLTEVNVDYFIKIGNLKSSFTVTLYVYGSVLPIIFESRLGGGRIILHYIIAPRVPES